MIQVCILNRVALNLHKTLYYGYICVRSHNCPFSIYCSSESHYPSRYCMPSSTDCIQHQNKLEELGVKYALQKREASASNEIQSL